MKPTITHIARHIVLCLALGVVSLSVKAQSLSSKESEPPVIQINGDSHFEQGKAQIQIDARSAEQIPEHEYNYQIMIMPEEESEGMFISNKSGHGFTVTQMGSKRNNSGFSWTLIATPKPTEGGPTIKKLDHNTVAPHQHMPSSGMLSDSEHID